MALVIIIQLFIIGGFFVIAVAPWLKLFKKAGVPAWMALIPGANAFSFARICARPAAWASILSFIALPVFWFLYVILVFQGGDPTVFPETVLLPLAALAAAFYLFGFPLLSTTLLVVTAYLLSFAPPTPGLMTALTAAIISIACGQAVLDFLNWSSLLTKLRRPLWHLVFIFIPFVLMLALVLVGWLIVPAGIEIVLGVLYASLLPGFTYVYYLSFSPKVAYVSE
jgi:hypothetical protein